jgi:hypothetical protein
MTKFPFHIGGSYTRKEIQEILEVPEGRRSGNWLTGYHCYNKDWYIFSTIGTAGRTGHDYDDHFEDNDFIWYGKTGSKLCHPSIQSLINPDGYIHLFVRKDDRKPFTYYGPVKLKAFFNEIPVKIIWEINA